jgi:hypothetical protein
VPESQHIAGVFQSRGAVGAGNYTVEKGDCISSIANRSGHFWKVLWEHPENTALRGARGSPNILLAGDRLTIPPLREKHQACGTERRHKFVRKGEPARLRIRVMMEPAGTEPGEAGQSGQLEEPRVNQDYVIEIDGRARTGTTDSDGWIDIPIPCDARHGRLRVGPDNFEVELNIGHLDPEDNISGLQARLTNLGYVCCPTGTMDDDTRAALLMFQAERQLEPTGEFDDATLRMIKEIHET